MGLLFLIVGRRRGRRQGASAVGAGPTCRLASPQPRGLRPHYQRLRTFPRQALLLTASSSPPMTPTSRRADPSSRTTRRSPRQRSQLPPTWTVRTRARLRAQHRHHHGGLIMIRKRSSGGLSSRLVRLLSCHLPEAIAADLMAPCGVHCLRFDSFRAHSISAARVYQHGWRCTVTVITFS